MQKQKHHKDNPKSQKFGKHIWVIRGGFYRPFPLPLNVAKGKGKSKGIKGRNYGKEN